MCGISIWAKTCETFSLSCNRMATNKRRNTVLSTLCLLDKYTIAVVSPSPRLQWVVTLFVSQCVIRERLLRLELAREAERIQLLRKVCHWAHRLTATVWCSTKSNTNSREEAQTSSLQSLVDHLQPYLWEIHLTWFTLVAFHMNIPQIDMLEILQKFPGVMIAMWHTA